MGRQLTIRMASPLLCCIGLVLNIPVLFRYVKAISPARDDGFATVSNNAGSDPCNQLNDYVKWEEKRAADRACGQAFLALDEHNANSCRGWRKPACRLLPGFSNQQCSCVISVCNQAGVKSDETKAFRECASNLRPNWYFTEEAAQASGFHDLLRRVQSKASGLRAWPSFRSTNAGGSSGAGISNGPTPAYGGGMPGGAASHQDAGTSRGHKIGAGGKTFACDICFSVYQSVNAMRDHRRRHTEDLQCKICQKPCSSRTNFLRHVKGVHKGNVAAASGKDANSNKELMEAYNLLKPHLCDVCGARYVAAQNLKNHKISHDNPESATCIQCKQTFSTPSNYRSHMRLKHSCKKNEKRKN